MLVWYLGVQTARRVKVCRQIIKFVIFPECIIPRVHPRARIYISAITGLSLSFVWKTSVNVQQAIASVRLSECFIVYTRRAQILELGGHGQIFFFFDKSDEYFPKYCNSLSYFQKYGSTHVKYQHNQFFIYMQLPRVYFATNILEVLPSVY